MLQLQVTRLSACCDTKRCKQHFFWFDVCFACDHVEYFYRNTIILSVDLNFECLTYFNILRCSRMIKKFISMFYIWIIVQTIKNINRHSYFCFEFRTSILNFCAHFFIILRCAICVKSFKSSFHTRIDFIFRWTSFVENHVFTLNFIYFINLLLDYIWIECLNIRLFYSFKRLIVCWLSRIVWWKIWTRFWIRESCHRFFFYKVNSWFRLLRIDMRWLTFDRALTKASSLLHTILMTFWRTSRQICIYFALLTFSDLI